ncbi:MAG TPA: class I SAM-dependent methyltransferase, partial [Methylomirabilota bacterium]|nr:class I SAM-dependent methyltransferase [Methylomirabilota bacterium]
MTAPGDAAADVVARRRDAFLERLLQSTRGTFELFSIYLGVRLGFYEALAAAGPATSGELASRTATAERYVREWLEQQTVTGILEVDDETAEARRRRFSLPGAYVEVLVDRDSLNYLAPLARLVAGAVHPLAAVLQAYRTGGGVPYAAYGADLREGQAGVNRAMFLELLGREWLPAMPDVHARLLAEPPARIADLGCGAGWSSIGMARSYPRVLVDGFDLDGASIDLARSNAGAAGLADRVTFHVRDAGSPDLAGRYDLVTMFESLHDMSQPVSALRTMRQLAGGRGAVLVVDERVGDAFTAAGNDVEWMMYGWSILHCLPVGKADTPSAETGTVLRPDTLRRYAG